MKTDTKHTPGPWRIDSKTQFGDYTIASGASVRLCTFIAKTQDEANATLIAAAPELLACLKDLLDNAEIDALNEPDLEPRCDAARAAILKAEGNA